MGFLDTVKGWLNIGGVKVKLQGVNPRVPRSGSEITGKVLLTSKGDKQVLKMVYRLIARETKVVGQQREVTDHTLSEVVGDEPFEIKTGETKTFDFSIPYSFNSSPKAPGGVLGVLNTLGQMGNRASTGKETYFVMAICDVKGTALDPKDKVQVTLVD